MRIEKIGGGIGKSPQLYTRNHVGSGAHFFELKQVFYSVEASMGGPGSGSAPNNSFGAGRKKKMAVAVVGTGKPMMPDGLPDAVQQEWHRLVGLTAGVTFEQDSDALLEAARLVVRQRQLAELLDANPGDLDTQRVSLAVGRALLIVLAKLGMTPRDRQVLLVPRDESSSDPIQDLLARRVPCRDRSKSRFFDGRSPQTESGN